METFIERLKKLRKEKQMTQKEFAVAIDKSIDTVKKWETGERKPPLKEAERIADYFGVKVSYLLGKDIFRDDSEHSSEAYWNDDELIDVITQDIRQMRMTAKMEVFDFIQELRKSSPELFTPEEEETGISVIVVKEQSED